MKLKSFLSAVVILGSIAYPIYSWCQDTEATSPPVLPEILLENKEGINILSFYNPYEYGIKTITVHRSPDSSVNFTTIGVIPKKNKGIAAFVDPQPILGKNWYQVSMEFTSGVSFNSNIKGILVDSAMLAQRKPIMATEDLQEKINEVVERGSTISVAEVVKSDNKPVNAQQSKYVFTNPFTGNINIELSDALTTSYRVEFFNSNQKRVVLIPRVNSTTVILDKRNFNQQGVHKFKLYKNGTLFEEGFVTIY
ncbi:MAG TPA: hypothetical protein VKZ76_04215 [Edaphocola sp.]|nr:hypothetical protein [Edaphocola sp.]